MYRKLFCSMVVMMVGVAFVAADDIRVTITKVDGDKITAYKNKTKTSDKGEEVTYTAEKGIKVLEGTAAKKGKVDEGGEIKGGLSADVFKNIDKKGLQALISVEGTKASKVVVIMKK